MAEARAAPTPGYMDRLTPFNAVVISFGAWLVVFLVAPIEPRWAEDPTGYMLAVLGLAGLLLGAKLPEAIGYQAREVIISEKVFRRALNVCLFLGMIGLAFKLFDTIVLRGVDLSDNAINAREQLGRGETNGISVAAAALLPLGNAALLIAWYGKVTGAIKRIGLTTWVVAAAPGVLPVLIASRSALMIFGCLIFAAWLNLASRVRARHFLFLSISGFAATTLFAAMFVNRVEMSGQTMLVAARASAYTQVVPLTPAALSFIDGSGEMSALMAGYASMLQYYVSGLVEFVYLVDLKTDNFGAGVYTFFFVPKIVALVTAGGYEARLADMGNEILNPRSGVFQSFFGPLYLDFGNFVPLFCVLFGAITGFLRETVRRGNVFAFPLYTFMLMQLLTAANLPSLSMNAAILSNLSLALLLLVGMRLVERAGAQGTDAAIESATPTR